MPKIKMYAAIPRKPGMPTQQFHDHWRHPHGTLGRQVPLLSRYVQSHRIDSDLLDESQKRFDGVAECWFNNAEDAGNFGTDPLYVSQIKDDELIFIDMPELRFVFTHEEWTSSGNRNGELLGAVDGAWCADDRHRSVKVIQFIEEEGSQPWISDDDHELGYRIGAMRQSRCTPIAAMHPEGAFIVGVRELTWPTLTDLQRGVEKDPAAWRALIDRPKKATTLIATAERFL